MPKTTRKVNSTVSVKTQKQSELGISPFNILAMVIVLTLFGFLGFIADNGKNDTINNQQNVAAVSAVAYDGEDGKNALDLLKNKAEIQTQDSSIGVFVVSINGVANSDNHFWMFYVNNELAQSSADQYITKNGEKIEWRYEQFQ